MIDPDQVRNADIYSVLIMCLEQIENKDWLRVFGNFLDTFHSGTAFEYKGYNDDSDDSRFRFLISEIARSRKTDIIFDLSENDIDQKIQQALNDYYLAHNCLASHES